MEETEGRAAAWDWICPKCNNSNFSFRTECNTCGEPRGNTPDAPSDGSGRDDRRGGRDRFQSNDRGRGRDDRRRDEASAPKETEGTGEAAATGFVQNATTRTSPSAQNATRAVNLEATLPMRLGMIAEVEVTNEEGRRYGGDNQRGGGRRQPWRPTRRRWTMADRRDGNRRFGGRRRRGGDRPQIDGGGDDRRGGDRRDGNRGSADDRTEAETDATAIDGSAETTTRPRLRWRSFIRQKRPTRASGTTQFWRRRPPWTKAGPGFQERGTRRR